MTTVVTTASSGPYTAAAQTTFAVDFQSISVSEIYVTLDGVIVDPSLYTFNRNTDGTGSVVFTLPQTGQVEIFSDPDYQNSTSFLRNGPFYPDLMNAPLDRIMRTAISLRARMTAAEADIDALEADLDAEISDREADVDALTTSLANELTARQAADTGLNNAIAAETTNRQNADNALTAGLNAETTARNIADNSIIAQVNGVSGSIAQAFTVMQAIIAAGGSVTLQQLQNSGMALRPEWFGALGNAISLDQPAFTSMTAAATALGYAVIELKPVTYIVGDQTPTSGGFYRKAVDIISVTDLQSLVIRGNGATLRCQGGMKYGAWDPVTNLPNATWSSSNANIAQGPKGIFATRIPFVHVTDLVLDGNAAGFTIGNDTSSNSCEALHMGYQLIDCKRVLFDNVVPINWLEDCGRTAASVAVTELDNDRPQIFRNCVHDNAGRNSAMIGSGVNVIYDNCSFTHPGSAFTRNNGTGAKGTSPRAAFDIEAEAGLIRKARFRNCFFGMGPDGQSSVVASGGGDTKDVTFEDCIFVGRHWMTIEGLKFIRCKFFGWFQDLYDTVQDPSKLPNFINCEFYDTTLGDTPLQSPAASNMFAGAPVGVIMRGCRLYQSRLKMALDDFDIDDTKVFTTLDTTVFAAGTSIMTLGAATVDNLKIFDQIAGNFPNPPFFINTGTAKIKNSLLTSATPNIQWVASDTTGFAGPFDNQNGTQLGTNRVTVDADYSVRPRKDKRNQVWDVAMAANRTITLGVVGVVDGDTFKVTRTVAATGASTLSVGGRKALAAGQWCEVTYSAAAAAWVLTNFGSL